MTVNAVAWDDSKTAISTKYGPEAALTCKDSSFLEYRQDYYFLEGLFSMKYTGKVKVMLTFSPYWTAGVHLGDCRTTRTASAAMA